MASGACAIAAGFWNSGRDNSRLLSLHGLGLATFGLIGLSSLVRGPMSFRPVSLFFVVMAASIGAFALRTAPPLRRGAQERSVLSAAGAASICFALSFFAVGFKWVRLGTPYSFWIWMCSHFTFCAVFMLWLAKRLHSNNLHEATAHRCVGQ